MQAHNVGWDNDTLADMVEKALRSEHGSGLGRVRWVVERTVAWLHRFRRLRIRYERCDQRHLAFLKLGCAVICQRLLA